MHLLEKIASIPFTNFNEDKLIETIVIFKVRFKIAEHVAASTVDVEGR